MNKNESLRTILRANAAFAAATGAFALAATGTIAEVIGVSEHRLISAIGAALLVFAAQLMFVSGLNGKLLRRSARLISASDFAWVAGTVAIITITDLRTQGELILAGIAAIVGTFGVLQLRSAAGVVDDGGRVTPNLALLGVVGTTSQASQQERSIVQEALASHLGVRVRGRGRV